MSEKAEGKSLADIENGMDKLASLCKRRGFVFQDSEIYGGISNTWDLGHVGNEFFNKIGSLWWKKFVQERGDTIGVRGAIIMSPRVWEASGHLESLADPLVECKNCHKRFRADHQDEVSLHEKSHGDEKIEWTDPKNFNLLFKTFIGTIEDDKDVAYLRGETAQTMFVGFKNILETSRRKLPFGIAQIGKAFRNEITPGNFVFRTREFTIAELEYFVKPGDDEAKFDEWLQFMELFNKETLGVAVDSMRRYEHPKKSLAHYSKRTVDIEFKFPWGWGELWGLANRTDFDLKNHERLSGQNLKYRDVETNEEFWPFVVEPTVGLERLMMALLINAYREYPKGRSGEGDETEVVLHLDKKIAPISVAVLPLSKKDNLTTLATSIADDLRKHFTIDYDETQSIGKRYRRQDEIGTPYCVTVDFDSIEDKKVTVRDRDTMEQERVSIGEISDYLKARLRE